MFSRFLSINPVEPELLIDISKEHKANSDYPDGYPYIHNYGAGGGGSYAALASQLKSPELYYNPWILTSSNRCEAVELKTGVWHITKLTPPTTDTFNSILFSCLSSTFIGLGTKFGIYISKPEGKEFGTSLFYYMDEDSTEMLFSQYLVEGMNVVDLTRISGLSGFHWRLKVPESFYNQDENGGLLETETDFYVIFFPVLDESQCNGYGEYLIPKFNNALWRKHSENIVISDDGLTVDTTEAEHYYDLRYFPQPYYEDDYIAVYSPEFLNISCAENRNIIAEPRGIKGGTSEIVGTNLNIGRTTGTNSPFYGGVIFKESYDSVRLQIYFSAKGVFTMFPYNNDRFSVTNASGENRNYVHLLLSDDSTDYFHDKAELQTFICKVKSTFSTEATGACIYRNEFRSDVLDKISLYGVIFGAISEDSQESFSACLSTSGRESFLTEPALVSYLDGRYFVPGTYHDNDFLNKVIVMSVVLTKNEATPEDCTDTGVFLFGNRTSQNLFSGQLYYLIGFKERLTPWQIAYYIKQMN